MSIDVIELARDLIRVPSVTALQAEHLHTSTQALDVLEAQLAKLGFTCWRKLFEGGHAKWSYPVDNLYAEITLGTPQSHFCYLGHVDVVPVGEHAAWRTPPFAATLEDGYLYGRGTTDMKGSVAAITSAVAALLQGDTSRMNLRIGLLITTDEEWAAVNGTKPVLKWLKEELGRTIDMVLVGEPSSQDKLGSHIKIGRRGSLCGTLTAHGVQGHAAYPDLFQNPNRTLALALAILHELQWDDGSANYPHTQFETVALIAGDRNATAVIPQKAEAVWNIRFTPQQNTETLVARLRDALSNPPAWAMQHADFKRLSQLELVANVDTVSVPYASTPAVLASALQAAITATLGSPAQLDATGGTTDGRFVQSYFPQAEVLEFGLPERGGLQNGLPPHDYLKKGGMHQADERASVSDLQNLQRIYLATLQKLAST